MKFIEDMSLEERHQYLEERRERIKQKELLDEKIGIVSETIYKCEQINLIKLNANVTAHSVVKTKYALQFLNHSNAVVKLIDSVYNLNKSGTKELSAFISRSDQIKNKIHFLLDDKGFIKEILNKKELHSNWKKYLDHMDDDPYINKLAPESKNKIIEAGNIEFALSKDLLLKNSLSNLFNRIIFDQYLKCEFDHFEKEIMITESHLFPDIKLSIKCNIDKISENRDTVRYRKVGIPLSEDTYEMKLLYEQFYKQQVQFQFTDFIYEFTTDYIISKKDNRIIEANANIIEAVKNNIESNISYHLKKIDL